MSSKQRGVVKFGVAIPSALAEELEKAMKLQGYASRSQLVAEALRLYLTQISSLLGKGVVVGIIVVVYNHEVKGAEDKLTDIQHKHLNAIIAATHIHLTRELCMTAIAVRGDVKEVNELVKELRSVRGVLHVTPHLISLETLDSEKDEGDSKTANFKRVRV
ncbi:MAG TPA: CopG family ribbon-helix-helix protein [Pyrodictium sp.]|nr:CopG family ribbon-helix-helix protein [Pyrodictium sp.]HIQ55836.1 CopG family ribbon-helix-helix protein [Pyrodictium sp.]